MTKQSSKNTLKNIKIMEVFAGKKTLPEVVIKLILQSAGSGGKKLKV